MKNPHNVPPTRFMSKSPFSICCSHYSGPVFGYEEWHTEDEILPEIEMHHDYWCVLSTKGYGYECHPEYKTSLFNDQCHIQHGVCEVYGINFESRYNLNRLCKHPDIMMEYVETKDISEETLKQFDDDTELLEDLAMINCNDKNILFKISQYYFTNPSKLLSDTHIVDQRCDACLNKWFNKSSQWKLIYRASEHGYTSSSFHEHCDDKGPTLIIIKTTGGWIFGGYITKSWSTQGICTFLSFICS